MLNIDYHSYRSVQSYDSRVRFLIIHYTADNFANSAASLMENVSAHYLVPDPTDATYINAGYKDMRVFNMVDETERAWHAGVSVWGKVNSLNFSSIGIEIVNQATEKNGVFHFPPYNDIQIDAVLALAQNIIQRHPEMTPDHILAHSDIAPYRKSDPGPAFPWKKFYEAGVGAWYDDETKQRYMNNSIAVNETDFLTKLAKYGYDTSLAIDEKSYTALVRYNFFHQ